MQVGVGFVDHPESRAAGIQAAQMALAGKNGPCDLVLLFATAPHHQERLREAVAETVGRAVPIYGGGAAGIITNNHFGYAGNQVGVCCIWLEGSDCTVLSQLGMAESEKSTGQALGKRLLTSGVTQEQPLILLYDAICRDEGMRLLLASWLLEGLEQGMGFLPPIMGAGLQGDHACTCTRQYIGDQTEEHCALALHFSPDIAVDSTVLHGCRPASAYFTVTKAEGPVILEIDGVPALEKMAQVLGDGIPLEQYPFFLLFGLNHGAPWAPYDENNYASRLCLDIDRERGGIVMFEPDMIPGTRFQLMFRSLDLDYMRPKIQGLLDGLGDREPIFAFYIDCAGRCAGYAGVDMEDALVVQQAVGNRFPLFGIYTGAEIAPMGGKSRGLDLTGVFCLFSKKREGNSGTTPTPPCLTQWDKGNYARENWESPPIDALTRLCEGNAAKLLALDAKSIAIRHELEQKRRGFTLLSELSVAMQEGGQEDLFSLVTRRINSALNMQKTAVLLPDSQGRLVPSILQGFSQQEMAALTQQALPGDPALLSPDRPVVVTAADSPQRLRPLREALGLPYFVSAPVVVKNEVAAVLITGRTVETPPFLSRLGRSDMETVQAVAALLASVLVYRRWDDARRQAQTDGLTGLFNRGALEQRVERFLQEPSPLPHAFFLIDCDYFKEINDTYGHLEGDRILQSLSALLREKTGEQDWVARIGGDEFGAFCPLPKGGTPKGGTPKGGTPKGGTPKGGTPQQAAKALADQLVEAWRNAPHTTQQGQPISSTISIGIALFSPLTPTYDTLFHQADMALYRAKEQGRNCASL